MAIDSPFAGALLDGERDTFARWIGSTYPASAAEGRLERQLPRTDGGPDGVEMMPVVSKRRLANTVAGRLFTAGGFA